MTNKSLFDLLDLNILYINSNWRMSKGKKVVKILLASIVFIAVAAFAVNWYFTYRFETFLKERLDDEIATATDGFYHFSFQKLTVDFFDGELKIEGIKLKPDSLVFERLKQRDSLPEYYYEISVNSIDFKGINLVWRRNYRKLNFKLFEIKQPNITVFNYPKAEKEEVHQAAKSIYETISPYFDVIGVQKINLEDANVSFIVEGDLQPIKYSLQNINFKAYNFLLNDKSQQSGKLLYCDNFEFSVNKPQTILSDSQLSLTTDSIRLSTADSIISIKGIYLRPQDKEWRKRTSVVGNYIDTEIKSVEAEGISFSRRRGLNYLDARTFVIEPSFIDFYTVKQPKQNKAKDLEDHDTPNNWSLYSIISPILHRVSIGKVELKSTSLDFHVTQDHNTDYYSLTRFDFRGMGFLIDSLAETKKQFWHSNSYHVGAQGIKVVLPSKNIKAGIERFALNTIEGNLNIDKISVLPISTSNIDNDYIKGSIDRIDISGLEYNDGIDANTFEIGATDLEYFKVKGLGANKRESAKRKGNILDLFFPYSQHLHVKKIKIGDVNFSLYDVANSRSYNIKDFSFFADNFYIDERTRQQQKYFFTCRDFGFSFKNFDNYLPGNIYRLKLDRVAFSSSSKELALKGIALTPNREGSIDVPPTHIAFSSPSITVSGIDFDLNKSADAYQIKSVAIVSPHIKVVKESLRKKVKESKVEKRALPINNFLVGNIKISNPDIYYSDKINGDSLLFTTKDIIVESLDFRQEDNYSVGKIGIGGIHANIAASGLKLKTDIKTFDMLELNWEGMSPNSSFSVGSFGISNPDIHVFGIQKSGQKDQSASKKDIYTVLNTFARNIHIGHFDLNDAAVVYGEQSADKINFMFHDLNIDTSNKTFALDDYISSVENIRFPIDNGLYNISIGGFEARGRDKKLKMEKISMDALYPKTEFAYKHPQNKDWFDLKVDRVSLSDMDLLSYFRNKKIEAGHLEVDNTVLLNYKNKKIATPPKMQPMIYTFIQKLPVQFYMDSLDVRNFEVVYEELASNGTIPGKIFFTNMNGKIREFTNIISRPNQFMTLDANGKLMGTGYFDATWMIPVEEQHDQFYLKAHLKDFDLKELNQVITPLAPAEAKSGFAHDVLFNIDATSEGANIDMSFLYNDLSVNILRNNEEGSPNRFVTYLANKAIKANNPNKGGGKPREAQATIVRDKYHSTFNYFWQILQPALVESVGITKKKQNFAKKAVHLLNNIKGFFGAKKNSEEEELEMKKNE